MSDKPTIRWGILGTGTISSWFVDDNLLPREDAKANHIFQAIGSSSIEKGKAFAEKFLPGKSPSIYGTYEELYADPNVDVVYIGTPHGVHRKNCLDAIAHGKHILCEKSFTITAKEAREVLDAAKKKGVYVMEAMWTRHFPAVLALQKALFEDKVIGDIKRVHCDFAMDQGFDKLAPESRLRKLSLGAATLLDLGVYPLTWILLALEPPVYRAGISEKPRITAVQTLKDGVDIGTTIVTLYPDGRQGVATASMVVKMDTREFCRINGTEGTIVVEGNAPPAPTEWRVKKNDGSVETFEFPRPGGRGFYWEADAVALDIAAGRTESEVMPWAETIRVMEIMDETRRQGGAKLPQDDE